MPGKWTFYYLHAGQLPVDFRSDGTYTEHFKNDRNLYVYSRDGAAQRLLVICSFADRPAGLKVPKSFDLSKAELVLRNVEGPAGQVLMPYEARVYLWNK